VANRTKASHPTLTGYSPDTHRIHTVDNFPRPASAHFRNLFVANSLTAKQVGFGGVKLKMCRRGVSSPPPAKLPSKRWRDLILRV
jgi:hypothetical protein